MFHFINNDCTIMGGGGMFHFINIDCTIITIAVQL